MDKVQPDLLPGQRSVLLGLLLMLVAAAWAGLIWHSHTTTEMTIMHAVGYARHFIADWVVMMVAMMVPTALPMILTFHKVQAANRQPRDAFVSTWVFAAAYLLVWAFAGLAAYVGMQAAEAEIARVALAPTTAAQDSPRTATASHDNSSETVNVLKLGGTINTKALPRQEIPPEVYQ